MREAKKSLRNFYKPKEFESERIICNETLTSRTILIIFHLPTTSSGDSGDIGPWNKNKLKVK